MKLKSLITTLILIVVLAPIPGVHALLDSQDIVEIKIPPPNSTVSNTTELKFRVYDDDLSVIPVRIEVLDSRCVGKLRTIVNSNYPSSKSEQVRGWNTAGGYTDGSALSDGDYCLSLCADMKNNTQPYGVCRRQSVTIRNRANNAPVITSTPSTSVSYGGNYNYNIQVTDADGDNLTYRITQKPGFLSFGGTRLVGNNITQSGKYKIVIEVSDGFGGLARQTYNLTVANAPSASPQPTPGTPEPEQPTPDEEDQEPVSVEFVFPQADSILAGENNLIEWLIENVDTGDIEAVKLLYSPADNNSWQSVTDSLKTSDESFAWDVSGVDDGDYKLRIIVEIKDKDDLIVDSSVFSIQNEESEAPVEQEPIIVSGLSPENGSAVTEISNSKIQAVITVDKEINDGNLDITQLKVSLNENEITDSCSLENQEETETTKSYKLTCEVDPLSPGEYRIKIEIPEQGFDKQSSFTIVEATESTSQTRNLQDYLPLVVIGSVVLCLVLLPLILLSIVRRRRSYYYETDSTDDTSGDNAIEQHTINPATSSGPLIGDAFDTNANINPILEPSKPAEEPPKPTEVVETTTAPAPPPLPIPEKSSIGSKFSGLGSKIRNAIPTGKSKPEATQTQAQTSESPTAEHAESTAKILEGGDNNFSLNDNYAADNPTAPLAAAAPQPAPSQPAVAPAAPPAVSAPAAPAPVEAPAAPSQPASKPVSSSSDDDLPDWLKGADENASTLPGDDDVLEQRQQNQSKKTDNGLNDDDDDGADPYGFGEYSLGDPN